MMKKLIYGFLCVLAISFMLVACTDDDSMDGGNEAGNRAVSLSLFPYFNTNIPEVQMRSLFDDGGYKHLVAGIPSSIGVFLSTQEVGKDPVIGGLTKFVYDGIDEASAKWTSSVHVAPDMDYKIYGFMPSDIAKTPSVEYTNSGANVNLKLEQMDAVANSDVCVIVGVHDAYQGANDTDENGKDETTGPYHNVQYSNLEASGIQLGDFGYHAWKIPTIPSDASDELKRALTPVYGIYLLMDHLFSQVNFSFKVGTEYDKVRTIEITKLEVICSTTDYVDATIKLTPNTTGAAPITNISYSPYTSGGATSTSKTTQIYPNNNVTTPNTILTTSLTETLHGLDPVKLPGYFAPAESTTAMNGKYKLKTTYNVYDKTFDPAYTGEDKETKKTAALVRGNCVSENKLKFPAEWTKLERGTKYTIEVTVEPTYLYQLSDHDLNNPTFTITNN